MRSDLRIRYGRGGWQVVNWMVNPFALVGVYLLLRVIVGRGGDAAALSIACALVPSKIVLLGFESAMNAVALREPVLLNRRFDRLLLPPSSVLTEGFAFAASFRMFAIAMAFYGVAPTLALLWLPVVWRSVSPGRRRCSACGCRTSRCSAATRCGSCSSRLPASSRSRRSRTTCATS